MKIPTFLLTLSLFLGLSETALAGNVFKCVSNGKVQYQNTACDSAAKSKLLESDGQSNLIGCYATPIKGMEEGLVVRRGAKSPYEMFFTEGKRSETLPLKMAAHQEIQQISTAFGINVAEGLSMKWPPDTPNQKPVGIYKGRDRTGKDVMFAYFFFDGGLVTKTPCK